MIYTAKQAKEDSDRAIDRKKKPTSTDYSTIYQLIKLNADRGLKFLTLPMERHLSAHQTLVRIEADAEKGTVIYYDYSELIVELEKEEVGFDIKMDEDQNFACRIEW